LDGEKMKNIDLMRPKNVYDKVLLQREEDGISFYSQFSMSFVDVDCPACGSKAVKEHFKKYKFSHKLCSQCNTMFCSPRPKNELISKYYNEFEAPKLWTKLLLEADIERKVLQYRPRVDKVLNDIRSDGSEKVGIALDVGAGSGAYALALKASAMFEDVIAFDLSDECVKVCREKGLNAASGQLKNFGKGKFGFLCMNDLIEHLFEPVGFLKECFDILKPGGYISIATPNGEGFDFKILKENTKNITPPEHLNYFNPDSIGVLLERAGFQVVRTDTPGVLDAQIIQKEITSGFPLRENNEYLDYLLTQDDAVVANFQKFLSENGLSSHMLVLAKKPKENSV
jgi:SAM-dependent methyltransferase